MMRYGVETVIVHLLISSMSIMIVYLIQVGLAQALSKIVKAVNIAKMYEWYDTSVGIK